jgi:hypothetical protein
MVVIKKKLEEDARKAAMAEGLAKIEGVLNEVVAARTAMAAIHTELSGECHGQTDHVKK